jgi:hypothetical protein
MIPPTSIDGTDITGATIDGTDVQEITVDGQTVFTAGPLIIEDFESGNLNNWSTTSTWTVVSTNAPEGSLNAETDGPDDFLESFPGDGLPHYPTRGDKIRWAMRPGPSGNIDRMTFAFNYLDSNNYHAIFMRTDGGDEGFKIVDDSGTVLAEVSKGYPSGRYDGFGFDWANDDTITAYLWENSPLEDDPGVADETISANITPYTDAGDIATGIACKGTSIGYLDFIRKLED